MFSGNQETNLKASNENLNLKNSFAMSFKKPLPLGGSNFGSKNASLNRENPFLKKSLNQNENLLNDSNKNPNNSMEMNMVHRGEDLQTLLQKMDKVQTDTNPTNELNNSYNHNILLEEVDDPRQKLDELELLAMDVLEDI